MIKFLLLGIGLAVIASSVMILTHAFIPTLGVYVLAGLIVAISARLAGVKLLTRPLSKVAVPRPVVKPMTNKEHREWANKLHRFGIISNEELLTFYAAHPEEADAGTNR